MGLEPIGKKNATRNVKKEGVPKINERRERKRGNGINKKVKEKRQ